MLFFLVNFLPDLSHLSKSSGRRNRAQRWWWNFRHVSFSLKSKIPMPKLVSSFWQGNFNSFLQLDWFNKIVNWNNLLGGNRLKKFCLVAKKFYYLIFKTNLFFFFWNVLWLHLQDTFLCFFFPVSTTLKAFFQNIP